MTNPTLADLHALWQTAPDDQKPVVIALTRRWAAEHALLLGTKGHDPQQRRREALLALEAAGVFVAAYRMAGRTAYQVTPAGEWLAEHVLGRPLPALRWGE